MCLVVHIHFLFPLFIFIFFTKVGENRGGDLALGVGALRRGKRVSVED